MAKFADQAVQNDTEVLMALKLSDAVIDDTRTILAENPALKRVLANPAAASADKARAIARIFPEAIVPYLCVLCRHGAIGRIGAIFENYLMRRAVEAGRGVGTLWYAGEEPSHAMLRVLVFEKFGVRDIDWVVVKDPTLIGGYKIRIQDYVYDHSVAGSFGQLSQRIRSEVRR
ncbi:F0F1 ATP synthase subunit delta [Pseudoramibacter sp. HA2172]|uniref:F0F1 ATP synthase subunit delta n=1 Tax=Pseudoramibacter faecis TaxID=3108534 RepID=UPI002E7A4E04|nr:F0F1 ATP synthase subunit delta [Pseudoramibacter sp. HA2172]